MKAPCRLLFPVVAVCGAVSCRAADTATIGDAVKSLPEAIDEATRRHIMPTLERVGVKGVGVLEFLVVSGQDSPSPTPPGMIGSDLAAQFQTAILIDISRRTPIALLREPNAVAARIPGATHLTAAGREKLFSAGYPVVVGRADETVTPDAFVFGTIRIADDLETAHVEVRWCRPHDLDGRPLATMTARLDAATLASAGLSFVMPPVLEAPGEPGAGPAISPAALAADVREGRRAFPLTDPNAPVTFSIAYDGQPQRIETTAGRGVLRPPERGQEVAIRLARPRTDGRRYGVVLHVDGENTAGRGRSGRWILSDASPDVVVSGWSITDTQVRPFPSEEEREPRRSAFAYGPDTGTISIVVFADEADVLPVGHDATAGVGHGQSYSAMILSAGMRLDPTRAYASLDEAKALLAQDLQHPAGIVLDARPRRFRPAPDPVMSALIEFVADREAQP